MQPVFVRGNTIGAIIRTTPRFSFGEKRRLVGASGKNEYMNERTALAGGIFNIWTLGV
jgi:hypothetical protein